MGVPRDDVTAHMWLNLSASQGNEMAAPLRDWVEKSMSPEDISEAQKRAHDWNAKFNKLR